jgi:hypothetical protein
MKLRIAIWAGAGALVVILWTLYMSSTMPAVRGAMWTLAYLTCPIALARHYALSFYAVLLVNAATYALVGAVVEAIRGHFQQSRVRIQSNGSTALNLLETTPQSRSRVNG